jgi:type IX secretion system PorP/SprF family membrane protein
MKLRYIFISVLALSCFALQGQDFHNTYWQFSKVEVNPAFTGAFLGNLRVSGIGRTQGRGVANGNNANGSTSANAFDDLSLAVDGNIPFGLKDTDWVSVGLNVSRSTVGAGEFKRNFAGISLAYHLSLNKEQTQVFTLAGRYGNYSTVLNTKNNFDDPFGLANGGAQSLDLQGLNVEDASEKSSGDFMLGLMYTTPVGDNADLRFGVAADHLLRPRLSNPVTDTISGVRTNQNLERRFNAFAQYFVSVSDRLVVNPTILYMTTDNASVLLLQGLVSYLVNPEKDFILNAGIGARLNDNLDFPIFLGADIKDWKFGLSYDTNVVGLTQANRTFGAIELGATRIISWNKKAEPEPKYVCPRL